VWNHLYRDSPVNVYFVYFLLSFDAPSRIGIKCYEPGRFYKLFFF
jgi:hypothetical protein